MNPQSQDGWVYISHKMWLVYGKTPDFCGLWKLIPSGFASIPVFLCTLNFLQYFVHFTFKHIPLWISGFLICNFILSILKYCAILVFITSNSCGISPHVPFFTKPSYTFLHYRLPHTHRVASYKACNLSFTRSISHTLDSRKQPNFH